MSKYAKQTIRLKRMKCMTVDNNEASPVESIDLVPTAGEDDNEDNVTKNSKHSGDEEKDTLNIELKCI